MQIPSQKINLAHKLFLIIFGLFLAVIILESLLWIGSFFIFSLQEYRNFISLKKKGSYRILCLGESTTACGGKYSYPSQLEEILNSSNIGIRFSVINGGIGGTNTNYILAQLKSNLDKYQPDMVITMMGINDGLGSVPQLPHKKEKNILKYSKIYKLIQLIKLHLKVKLKKENLFIEKELLLLDPSEEEERLKKEITSNPNNLKAYIDLARHYYFLGDTSKAIEILSIPIEKGIVDYRVYTEIGKYYRIKGKFPEAENFLLKAIQLKPDNIEAYTELGICALRKRNIEEAESLFKKSIQINPNNSLAYMFLGEILLGQKRYEELEGIFKRCLEINSKKITPNLLYKLFGFLANVYIELKDNILAEEYRKKAQQIYFSYYNPTTYNNYLKLKKILDERRIIYLCVQYPTLPIEPLKEIFKDQEVIFVDNEKIFKEAIEKEGYDQYFTDRFAGSFGHCTPKGNRLLAENIARTILKEVFKR